jgi:hypothetical protein
MIRLLGIGGLVFTVLLIAACGDEKQSGPESALRSCDSPELTRFAISELQAQQLNCVTAGAVATEAADCYFASRVGACPSIDVAGTIWECSFSVTGPTGSGGLSKSVCLGLVGDEVRFTVQRKVGA